MIAAVTDRQALLDSEIARLEQDLDALLARNPTHAPNRKLLAHLTNEREHLLTFLRIPGAQATNWRAEQAIRPAVMNRKHWGGNRTDHGAAVQQTLMSVIRSARQQEACPIELLACLLRRPPRHRRHAAPPGRHHRQLARAMSDRPTRYRVTVHQLRDGASTKIVEAYGNAFTAVTTITPDGDDDIVEVHLHDSGPHLQRYTAKQSPTSTYRQNDGANSVP